VDVGAVCIDGPVNAGPVQVCPRLQNNDSDEQAVKEAKEEEPMEIIGRAQRDEVVVTYVNNMGRDRKDSYNIITHIYGLSSCEARNESDRIATFVCK
jgi:hypothetical protein